MAIDTAWDDKGIHTQHTQYCMGAKNISIPEDVYEKLREERREGESFGDAIDRLLGRRPLAEFWGAWSGETAVRAREAIEESRRRSDDRIDHLVE